MNGRKANGFLVRALAVALLAAAGGCSTKTAGLNGGSGGVGATGAGGAAGATGAGGAAGATGAGGAAGATGAGGAAGTGGAAGSAGAGGSAGAADGGGDVDALAPDGGAGGAMAAVDNFDTTAEDFVFSRAETVSDMMGNLVLHGATAPTLAWDGTQGDPEPGSLKVTAPYTDYGQFVEVIKDYGMSNLQSWAGRTRLHVRFKLASGGNPNAASAGQAILYTRSYIAGTDGGAGDIGFTAISADIAQTTDWQEMSIKLDEPGRLDWDKTKVVNFSLRLHSGAAASAGAAKPTPAVFYIDSFTLE
jgi:hypothetical protein